MLLLGHPDHELLMVDAFAETYRVRYIVKKIYRAFPDDDSETEESIIATQNEATIFKILGDHPRIAKCLNVDLSEPCLELEFYHNGNLKSFIERHKPHVMQGHLKHWARQILESVAYVHSMGVIHSDLRLEQWLLDEELNARLSDFNASGYEANKELGIEQREAMGAEGPSHFLPRDVADGNTFESDLFALASTLFELVTGKAPYKDQPPESIEELFSMGIFPCVDGLFLGRVMMGCWTQEFQTASDVLQCGEKAYRL